MKETLIGLAFRFRDSRLWDYLCDNNIFAVRLSDGRKAYCSVMGSAGQCYAIGVYIDAGWNTYLNLSRMYALTDELEKEHLMCTGLDCINCNFTQERLIPDSETKEEVLRYANAHGFDTHSPIGIPDFIRYSPYRCPSTLLDSKEEDTMEQVLSASLHLVGLIRKQSLTSLGFTRSGIRPSDEGGEAVPLLLYDSREWIVSKTDLPGRTPVNVSPVTYTHTDIAIQIALLPVRSNLECRLISISTPVVPEGERGFFPVMMMFVDGNTGFVNITGAEKFDADATPPRLVEELALKVLAAGFRPSTVYVMEDYTRSMLEDLCSQTGIKLQEVNRLKHLQEAWGSLSRALRTRRKG